MKFTLVDWPREKKILKWITVLVVVVAALITIGNEFLYQIGYYDDYAETEGLMAGSVCNVALVRLHGDMYIDADSASGEISSIEIETAIKRANANDFIKAIVLDINSYGGGPTAAEEIKNALKRVKKPTVALIRESGLSGAYLAATGAEVIFASKYSDVGSIGITMSYVDNVQKNIKEGLTYNQLSLGKFKDMANPDKPLTYEEKQLLMRDLKIIHENFIKEVAENRGLNIEKVRVLADGSSLLGEMALENGLVDKIGGLDEVKEYLKEKIGEEAVVCGE